MSTQTGSFCPQHPLPSGGQVEPEAKSYLSYEVFSEIYLLWNSPRAGGNQAVWDLRKPQVSGGGEL